MAIMIPSDGPRDHTVKSKEGMLFESLKTLPDDFYVVHSLDVLLTKGGKYTEREADFVVFHPKMGLLCIEAKAGQARYSDGVWKYGSGLVMRHGGPYRQADEAKYQILHRFQDLGLNSLANRCKFLHAVWFISLSRQAFTGVALPPEASLDITLFSEDIADPLPRIRHIMSLDANGYETNLSDSDARRIVGEVLCPEFSIVPTRRMGYDLADAVFARLLESQVRVLNYISDQQSAVVNGAAGTGKTLIAMERARRAAVSGKVLFLCYNALLRDYISQQLKENGEIDIYTVAGYACSAGKTSAPDYDLLAERIMEMQENDSFPYSHVIVDEGQDFGVAEIMQSDVLDLLRDAVVSKGGTFYLFYDKRQFVQGVTMPSLVNDADCKLTLYVNCRNTEGIARCSMNSLGENGRTNVLEGVRVSGPPHLFASRDLAKQRKYIDEEIGRLKARGLTDIVILTCKTVASSVLSNWVSGDSGKEVWMGSRVRFSTCRRFKGLEADAIILVDVDESLWSPPQHMYDPAPGLLFYTGASRAKHELRIVCDMDERGCERVLEQLGVKGKKKPVSRLAKQLNAVNVS